MLVACSAASRRAERQTLCKFYAWIKRRTHLARDPSAPLPPERTMSVEDFFFRSFRSAPQIRCSETHDFARSLVSLVRYSWTCRRKKPITWKWHLFRYEIVGQDILLRNTSVEFKIRFCERIQVIMLQSVLCRNFLKVCPTCILCYIIIDVWTLFNRGTCHNNDLRYYFKKVEYAAWRHIENRHKTKPKTDSVCILYETINR